jgi:hypothetical protein
MPKSTLIYDPNDGKSSIDTVLKKVKNMNKQGFDVTDWRFTEDDPKKPKVELTFEEQ